MALAVRRKERIADQEVLGSNKELNSSGCEHNCDPGISARVLGCIQLPQVRNPVLFLYSAARQQ